MIDTSLLTLDDCPSWRWDRAVRHTTDGTTPSRVCNDNLVRKGWQYLRRLNNCQSADDVAWLKNDYPALHKAYCLFENTRSLKWVLEATLLTRITYEDINAYTGIDVDAVDAYESYFFNVRDKLDFRGYISSRILLPVATNGTGPRDYDFMLKAVGYFGGWEILKEMLNVGPMGDENRKWFEDSFTADMWRKGLLAVRRLDPNNFNATEIIANVMKMIEIQNEVSKGGGMGGKGSQQAAFLEALQGLLNDCPTVTMKNAEVMAADEPRVLAGGVTEETYEIPVRPDAETASNG